MIDIISTDIQNSLKCAADSYLLSVLFSNRSTCYKTDSGFAITFRFCNLQTFSEKEDKVYILLADDHLTVITENTTVLSYLNKDKSMDGKIALHDFFSSLVSNDINELEDFENKISSLEDELLRGRAPDKNILKKIVLFKHRVLKIKRYYTQLEMICETLGENVGNIFSDNLAEKFQLSAAKIDRLLQNTLHLYECIIQVREVYQAQIDIEQNNVMKAFTVITTIFFPLTLIAGWYGMNLKMPEFSWDMGYLFVIILSLIVVGLSIVFFKIKKWF